MHWEAEGILPTDAFIKVPKWYFEATPGNAHFSIWDKYDSMSMATFDEHKEFIFINKL